MSCGSIGGSADDPGPGSARSRVRARELSAARPPAPPGAPRFTIEQLAPWIQVSYARSSGPGGQNVNKLNTRAEISFDFHACTLLRDPQRDAILARLSRRLTRDGRLRVVSQRARTQLANRIHAERQLLALLELALAVDRPRRPTAPTRASRAVRVRAKRQRGQVKRWRRGPSSAED